jgi:acyl-homoserine-lactone acylase
VAVVEFGERVRAKAVTAGGGSGDPSSPHFNDQALRYAQGELRRVFLPRATRGAHRAARPPRPVGISTFPAPRRAPRCRPGAWGG